jgi:arylsulfatase A-like enzyme
VKQESRGRFPGGAQLLEGALFGAAFALGEIVAAQLSRGRFSLRWFPFLCVYYVPACALAGWAAAWPRRRRPDPAFGLALLYHGILFLTVALESVHALARSPGPLVTRARLLAVALAAALAIASWIRASKGIAGRVDGSVWIALAFLLSPVCLLAGVLLYPLPASARLLIFAPAVGVLMELCRRALGARAARARQRFVTGGLLAAAGLLVVAWGLSHPAAAPQRGDERDDPQPAPVAAPPGAPRPNVVLIVADTLRASEMSCYGYRRRTTPRIDEFAAESTRYTRAIAAGNTSLPTHASLFTGLYATRNGAHAEMIDARGLPRQSGISPEAATLAQVLSSRGYATSAIVSNFVMVTHRYDLDRGFHHFDSRPSPDYYGFAYSPLVYLLRDRLPAWVVRRPVAIAFPTPYRPARKITDLAVDWLDRRPSNQPYFLFVNYLDPHLPYYAPRSYRTLWSDGRIDWSLPPDGLPWRSFLAVAGKQRPIRRIESQHLTHLYDGEVSYLDAQLGRLLDRLKADRSARNTWIILTADHGESLGEHNTLEHGCSLYQELVHVPLIIHYPDCCQPEAPSAVDTRPVAQVDIMPTILDALRIPFPGRPDGVSILSEERPPAYSEQFPNLLLSIRFPGVYGLAGDAVVDGRWKYISTGGGGGALFDLDDDPGEKSDVAGQFPEEAARLKQLLSRRVAELEKARPPSTLAKPTPEVVRQLRALGYLN